MAEKSTIARPYAKAAFQEAQGGNRLAEWSSTLRTGAEVVSDARVHALIGNPFVGADDLAAFVQGIAGPKIDEQGANFFRTLAENHRLGYLPEISAMFDELKDEAEGVIDVTVTSAAPIDDAQRQILAKALERKFKRTARLHFASDAALIGGAVLRAGDTIIDGSLLGRLKRIAFDLTA